MLNDGLQRSSGYIPPSTTPFFFFPIGFYPPWQVATQLPTPVSLPSQMHRDLKLEN